ncbi:MAG: hypothetical protein AAGB51_07355 [Planctomycetota bacterium]
MGTATRVAAGALLLAVAGSAANAEIIRSFALFNHPDGAVNPSAYGLRLDNFPTSNPGADSKNSVTFSFQNGGDSNVRLDIIDQMDGSFDLRISGTIWGNSANGGANLGMYSLDVTYEDVNVESDGWTVTGAGESMFPIGGLTAADATAEAVAGTDEIALQAKSRSNGLFFSFRDEPHRGNDGWNGFGWVLSTESSGTQDFLFRAVEVPPPSTLIPTPTAAALGMVGLGLVSNRRRRG